MPIDPSRRTVLAAVSFLGLPTIALATASDNQPVDTTPALPHFPRQDPTLVRETVGASHRDLDKVRELVTQHPALARCAWDWGFGDWESPLGAASHVGNRDIALFLIEHGASPDIFTHAMLGHLAAVKAIIEAQPGIQRTKGPHGIPLLRHARAGGPHAASVVEYLLTLKDAGEEQPSATLTPESLALYTGDYLTSHTPPIKVSIKESKGGLVLERESHSRCNIHSLGNHEFAPTGAPHVRITFAAADGPATALTVRDHSLILTAHRAG